MGREKWLKDQSGGKETASKSRKGNTTRVDDADDGSAVSKEVSRLQPMPQPSRTICDLASRKNWTAALERCHTHPEDMYYGNMRGSILHFALWAHRRSHFTMDESIGAKEEEAFCCFLDKLMTSNPDMISSVGSLGYCPLHIACSKDSLRNTHIVELLIKRSVPPDAKELHDILCETLKVHIPLEIACRIATFLPNVALRKDSQGKTPLFLASQFSKNIPRREKHCTDTLKDVVKMLVECAPKAKDIVDKTGRTPLEVVKKQKKYPELVDILS